MKYLKYLITALFLSVLSVVYLHSSTLAKAPVPTQQRNSFNQSPGELREIVNLTDGNEVAMKDNALYRKQVFKSNYQPVRNSVGINCTKVINNDQSEISKSKRIMKRSEYSRNIFTADFYLKMTSNCELFRDSRGYIGHPLSKMELEFPIAFSILVYKDIEQAERLLRLIYRPHNFYCIHLDLKMNQTEKKALRKIATCLNNVFIANESINVLWGDFSLLAAELACMKTLWPFKKWKYYINLTGQEFPLKTNRQMVAILKVLNGANVVEASITKLKKHFAERFSWVKTPPPHNLVLMKGSMHVAANRYFVDFCIHDPVSLEFQDWLKDTMIPDETFFATLNQNPKLGIPGSFLGKTEEYNRKPYFLRYTSWRYLNNECLGKYIREVCVLGVGDLHNAYNSDGLFANKLYLDYQPIALDCLEEFMYEKIWKEYLEDIPFDTSYYSSLDYAKLQVKLHEKETTVGL